MLKTSSDAVSEFLDRFQTLGEWNELDQEEANDLESILATANQLRFPGAILPLPRGDGPPIYYGAADRSSDWRALRTWLLAFAGPTVSNFTGRPHDLDPNNKAEGLLATGGFHAVARVEPSPATALLLRRSLRQLSKTAERMPDISFVLSEPRHRLIRRFFNSVAAGDLDAALECIAGLRRGLHLDTLNLAFLEVHARTAVGDWVGVAEMSEFISLLQARKPSTVSCALNEALYRAHLAGFVEAGDITEAVDRYREEWRPRIGGLPAFPTVGGTEGLARLYVIDALSRDGEPPPWRETLESHDLGRLAKPLSEAFPPGAVSRAKQPPPASDKLASARAALINAGISDALSAKRIALAEVASLADGERSVLFQTTWVRTLWEELVRKVGERPPDNWPSWLEQLSNATFSEIAADVARAAIDEWPHVSAFPDPARFADALRTGATGDIAPALRQGLPHFVMWLRADPEGPRPSWRSIYLAVVDAYSLAGELDAAAREATLPMIELALEAEPGAGEYRDLVEQADMLAGDDPGVHGAWWPLKVAELLLWYQTPDIDVRTNFLHQLLEKLRTSLPRLTSSQQHLARELSRSAEWPWPQTTDAGAEATEVTLADKLGGKTLAIYTLVERAAEQVRDILAALTPTTRVELCTDHVASPRLVALARNADVFVMVTGAAKHAATDAIKRERPKDKPLLMPFGKGASSILEAIDRWASLLHQRN